MASCHMCGSRIAENGALDDEATEGFECADCGEPTCSDCKSWALAKSTDHCKRCRG